MNKLRAGIIGLGVGEAHIAGYELHPMVKVTKICDFDKVKLNDVSRRYPRIQPVLDPLEILEDPEIDLVSIASYDNFHFEQIKLGLINGKHLFVEKPLVQKRDEAEEVWKILCEKRELKISSNLVLRKSELFNCIRRLNLVDNYFGNIYSVEGDYNYGRIWKIHEGWRGKIDFYSVTQGGGIHLIDLLLWITQKRVSWVFAGGSSIASLGTQFKFNDYVLATLGFEDGAIGKICSNYAAVYPHFHKVTIYGTKASFEHQTGGSLIFQDRDGGKPPRKISERYLPENKGVLIKSFVDSVLAIGEEEITKREIFDVMAICLAIEDSLVQKKVIQVNYFEE